MPRYRSPSASPYSTPRRGRSPSPYSFGSRSPSPDVSRRRSKSGRGGQRGSRPVSTYSRPTSRTRSYSSSSESYDGRSKSTQRRGRGNGSSNGASSISERSKSMTRMVKQKYDSMDKGTLKGGLLFLGGVAVVSAAAHKLWPKGFVYGDKEEWEEEKDEKAEKVMQDTEREEKNKKKGRRGEEGRHGDDRRRDDDREAGGRRRDRGEEGRGREGRRGYGGRDDNRYPDDRYLPPPRDAVMDRRSLPPAQEYRERPRLYIADARVDPKVVNGYADLDDMYGPRSGGEPRYVYREVPVRRHSNERYARDDGSYSSYHR